MTIEYVVRNQRLREMEILFEKAININGVKGGITEEGIRLEVGTQQKEIREHRLQCGGISNRLVFVRRIGFLFNRHFWVYRLKIIIQESNVAGNAQPVGEDNEFISIAEMPIAILLLGIGARSGL